MINVSILIDFILLSLILAGIYNTLSLGLNLQIGISRVLNMAYGGFIMLGAYSAFWLLTKFNINPFMTMFIITPFMLLIGYLLNITLFKRLKDRSKTIDAFEMNSLLVSFGILYIINNIALIAWGADVKGYNFMNEPITILGASFALNRYIILIISIIIACAIFVFLAITRLGKAGRAVSQDLNSAQLSGINIDKTLAIYFGIGTILASMAGVLLSMIYTITPIMGIPLGITAIVITVLGGLGNIIGGLLAALIMGIIASLVMHIDISLELSIFYLVFMLVLLLRPQGIMGQK